MKNLSWLSWIHPEEGPYSDYLIPDEGDTPLETMAWNTLRRTGFASFRLVAQMTPAELLTMEQFGVRSLQVTQERMKALGLSWPDSAHNEEAAA